MSNNNNNSNSNTTNNNKSDDLRQLKMSANAFQKIKTATATKRGQIKKKHKRIIKNTKTNTKRAPLAGGKMI